MYVQGVCSDNYVGQMEEETTNNNYLNLLRNYGSAESHRRSNEGTNISKIKGLTGVRLVTEMCLWAVVHIWEFFDEWE